MIHPYRRGTDVAVTSDLDTCLAEAQQRVEQELQVRGQLTKARELLAGEGASLQRLENRVAEIEESIQSLESLSLGSLWASIAGNKAQQLDRQREELAAAEQRCEACAEKVVALDCEIQALEADLQDLIGAQEAYVSLCKEKEALLVDGDDPSAEQLRNVIAEQEGVAETQRCLKGAVRTGKHLLERLHSLTSALGRARTKMTGAGNPAGMIGKMVTNAVGRKGAAAAISRARDGMKQFTDEVVGLDFGDDNQSAFDLPGLAASLAGYVEELTGGCAINQDCDMSALRPMVNDVQELVSQIENRLDALDAEVKAIESERRELIAQA